jgi:hypothetical protein
LKIPGDEGFVNVILGWAWAHGYLLDDIRKVYQLGAQDDLGAAQNSFFAIVRRWLAGDTYAEIATAAGIDVDDVLAIYTGAISY